MKDFIPLIRQDRLREMNEYKQRGYIFREHEPRFRFVRNISVSNKSQKVNYDNSVATINYFFQVRVEQSETRFFILQNSLVDIESCMYMTIFDIYELLLNFSTHIAADKIVRILMGERCTKWFLSYTGLEFEVDFFSLNEENLRMVTSTSNIKISFENLLLLISIIQDKSNYHWSNSKQEKSPLYIDGILRLFCCLISTQGHEVLLNNGWSYDNNTSMYKLTNSDNDKKYYLTLDQYKNIMGV